MIEYLCIGLGSLIIRLFPVRHSMTDFDTYGHLYFAKEVVAQNASPWDEISLKCWNSEVYMHPWLWHWVVGRLALQFPLDKLKWINPCFDALLALGYYGIFKSIFLDTTLALYGLLLYLFTPMWFSSISIGTRVASFTPRIISEILVSLLFILVLFDLGIGIWLQYALAVLAVISVVLSSKFGVQALILLAPITSLILGSIELFVILIIGFIIPIVISRGVVLKMLNHQIIHLKEYYQNNKLGKTAVFNRNKLSKIVSYTNKDRINFRQTIWNLMAFNSYTSVILMMPIYILSIVLCIKVLLFNDELPLTNLFGPVLAASIVFLIINRPNLLFLGESERYINHVAFFVVAVFVLLVDYMNMQWLFWLVISYGILLWLAESFIFNKLGSQKERIAADDLVEKYLKESVSDKLVLSFPYHNFSTYRVMFSTQHSVIYPTTMSKDFRALFTERFELNYPFVDLKKLDQLTKLTGLNFLIIDKRAKQDQGYTDWVPSKSWKKVNLDQTIYDVYELDDFKF